ncbi:winged helix DNA-binding domain-containing protein [Ruania suaedae]|uniref:winged helix DNA-binding domain-containing protein n=1 Tax=Ruania suaedae TaxID=2897774 RepID=UPI001E3C4716|nr:winged helix DNA-binding domain-containing protein [Ruania suaedae]UFU03732.1 winged helix DNA-binding domain-containing protein [Ruania suaedae]
MSQEIPPAQARHRRRVRQLLAGSHLSPTEVVQRAVALQGQDLPAVLRAIAIRSRPGTTVDDVRQAFDSGHLVRSWPMRGTLFATTPGHLATLLSLTAERTHRATTRRREQLGLDDRGIGRAREVLAEALQERPRSRAEALALWEAAGLATANGRGYHLLMHLAVGGLMHWGRFGSAGGQLLELSTAPAPEDPDAALAQVIRGFVAARGPVTPEDLAWWTKLPKTPLRSAAATMEDLVDLRVEGTRCWDLADDPVTEVPDGDDPPVDLVPGFDEWILGYADRSLVASSQALRALVPGGNGVFRPAVLVDGVVVGTWRRPRTPGGAVLELVEEVDTRTRARIDAALAQWPHD